MPRRRGRIRVAPKAARTYRGVTYASKAERDYARHLAALKRKGVVTDVQRQVRVKLTEAEIVYIPDFLVTFADGRVEYHEVKGMETDSWKVKKKLWTRYGPGVLVVIKKRGDAFVETERIER